MKKRIHLLILIGLLFIIAGLVVFAVYRVNRWINPVTLNIELSRDDYDNYVDNYDILTPLTDNDGYLVRQDVKTILILGNNPFYDDANDTDGLAALLEMESGANIINCSIPGTCMSSGTASPDFEENPSGLYSPYYLTSLLLYKGDLYTTFLENELAFGDIIPSNASDVVKILYETDPSDIDVIIYMYDLNDYEQDNIIYDPEDEFKLYTVCGNLNSAFKMIELSGLQIRPIVMSPYYTGYVDENGQAVSREFYSNTFGRPSDYVLCMADTVAASCNASFVDNYFGSITEDNYSKYLSSDNVLNNSGKELLISRLMYILTYFYEK